MGGRKAEGESAVIGAQYRPTQQDSSQLKACFARLTQTQTQGGTEGSPVSAAPKAQRRALPSPVALRSSATAEAQKKMLRTRAWG